MLKYSVIVQARNEEKFLPTCLQSVLNQTVLADNLLVVNDGSTDKTSKIISKYKIEELYLDVPRFKRRGINQSLAFNKGVIHLSDQGMQSEYIVKVDADTKLTKNYAYELMLKMMYFPKLGICSGMPLSNIIRFDRVSDTGRMIRKECWNDIEGYDLVTGFDSVAMWKAINKGWAVKSFNKPKYVELRSSQKTSLERWFYAGQLRRMSKMPFYYTFLGGLKNIRNGSPPIIGALTMMLSHLICTSRFDNLDNGIISEHAITEIKNYIAKKESMVKRWFG